MLKSVNPGAPKAPLPFAAADGGAPLNTAKAPKKGLKRPLGLGWIGLSAVICIALPTLLASLYYGLIASDQFAVEVRFAVRGPSGQGSSDMLGLVTGAPSAGSATADSYIVMDFIRSREILEKIAGGIDVRAIYGPEKGDYFASFDPSETMEELVEYWKQMIRVNYDTTSQVISIEARAFTAADAREVAASILKLSEDLINQLSSRARQDAVKYADQEVRRTEDRLRANRLALRAFRESQQELDPTKSAEARLTLLGKLEEELANAKAKRGGLLRFMQDTAPSIKVLDSQIKAVEGALLDERSKMGNLSDGKTGATPLSGLLADFEALAIEREFAEKAYVSALASLERARLEADQQQRYVAAFVTPSTPEEAIYPYRVVNTIITFFIAGILWALGLLMFYGIRDHAA